jgi:hypothetical protein
VSDVAQEERWMLESGDANARYNLVDRDIEPPFLEGVAHRKVHP